MILPSRGHPALAPAVSPNDRLAERALLSEAREGIGQLLGDGAASGWITPTRDEETRVRAMLQQKVDLYERRAATANTPGVDDPAGLVQRLFDRLLRMGVLQTWMDSELVEEICCNGYQRIFAIVEGQKHLLEDVYFESDDELRTLIKRLIGPLGKRLDESSPMVDARLPDGSRLNAVIPPASAQGTYLTIRKFRLKAHSLEQLVAFRTLTEEVAGFLEAGVQAGINMLVSGATGAGKTTLLNALGSAIASPDERIVTVEEVAELQLARSLPDCVALQARANNVEGVGEIRIRDLVRNALRMRPSRICVGEVRSGEALDMLLAMNTGHDGSLTTIHANSPRDALDRLVTLAMMAEERLSGEALTKMVARTIELVLQLRFEPRTGHRRLVSVFEITGLESTAGGYPVVTGQDLWTLDPDEERLVWTGIVPRCLEKMKAKGVPYALPLRPGRM